MQGGTDRTREDVLNRTEDRAELPEVREQQAETSEATPAPQFEPEAPAGVAEAPLPAPELPSRRAAAGPAGKPLPEFAAASADAPQPAAWAALSDRKSVV